MTSLPYYSYNPLPGPRSIRLIQLRPLLSGQSRQSTLRCTLKTVDLGNYETSPSFAALSYTWVRPIPYAQPTTDEHTEPGAWSHILCDGARFRITQNLQDALTSFSSLHHDDWVWIDAISINQADQTERSSQVSLMGDIFSFAQTVYVWLGKPDEHANHSLELIGNVMDDFAESSLSGEIDALGLRRGRRPSKAKISGELPSQSDWQHISAFFSRSWFERLWVIQEIVLAQNVSIIYGDAVLSWWPVMRFALYMRHHDYAVRYNCVSQGLEGVALMSAIKKRVPDLPHAFASVASSELYAIAFLRDLVISCRGRRLTDPRDRIYGPWALAAKLMEGGQYEPFLIPDYSKSMTAVFIEASVLFLLRGRDLTYLSIAEQKDENKSSELPSWVPDLNVAAPGAALLDSKFNALPNWPEPQGESLNSPMAKTFQTFGETHADHINEVYYPGGRLLELHGFSFAKIEARSAWPLETIAAHDVCQILSWFCAAQRGTNDSESILRHTFETLTAEGSSHPVEHQHIFRSWANEQVKTYYSTWRRQTNSAGKLEPWSDDHNSLDVRPHASGSPTSPLPKDDMDKIVEVYMLDSQTRRTRSQHERHPSPPSLISSDIRIKDIWPNETKGKCVLRTVDGTVGLGPATCSPDDEIWLFPGSRIPFVLRKLANGHHRLLGEAYVPGCMHGELSATLLDASPQAVVLE